MASKFLVFHMVLAVGVLGGVRVEGSGVLPVLRFTDAVRRENPAPINLQIKGGGGGGGVLRGSAQLKPGQDYQMRVKVEEVYYVTAVFGLRFTGFHAYEAARDKGHAAVYWRADNHGFAISHDNTRCKLVAPWESE